MPRDLPISNGNLMINFDHDYNIRDVYYPHVGQENQTTGDISHFGIWCDGKFAWIDSPLWVKHLEYEIDTLSTNVSATSEFLGIELTIRDLVDFDRDLFLRKIEVRNLVDSARTVRVYNHFDGHLWGNSIGDTVYFEPEQRSLVAYKGHRYVVMNGMVGDHCGFHAFAIGKKERDGFDGTWRDAEDGNLGGNPIAQGSVDSTGMIEFPVPPSGSETIWLWWAFAKNYHDGSSLDSLVRERGPESFHERTRNYWKLWIQRDGSRIEQLLPQNVSSLYRRSLLVLRTQIDNNGAVIAATDSDIVQFGKDTYTYVWPRDGALVTNALVQAGYPDITARFFDFCKTLVSREGYLLHKYNPDGSLGSSWHPWATPDGRRQLPIQEDETALVVWALWSHFDKFRDVEFVRPLYRALVKSAADFMVRYREPHSRLPAASYDLWEERRGILSFTVAAVWAGLQAAARFTEAFGEATTAAKYRKAADEIREGALRFLYSEKLGRFVRMINIAVDGSVTIDPTIDASVAGLWQFGMFDANDPKIVSTMESVVGRLTVRTPVGGVARYENDYYHQVTNDVENCAGNPWIICTLWVAEWYAARATDENQLRLTLDLLDWTAKRALASGVLAEQIHPFSGEPLSVSPLTWSHAAFVHTVHKTVEAFDRIRTTPRPAETHG